MVIKLSKSDDNIIDQIKSLIKLLEGINGITENNLTINLNSIKFIHPLTISGLVLINNNFHGTPTNVKFDFSKNVYCHGYLKTINFPSGMRFEEPENIWKDLKSFLNKTYIPLVAFNTKKDEKSTAIREKLFSNIREIVSQVLKLNFEYIHGVALILDELMTNIEDHSGSDFGWFFCQFYPKKEFFDICILDAGKTIMGSYHENGYSQKSHVEAIKDALNGLSTKNNRERGFGIPTTKSMTESGFRGNMCIISGNGLYYNKKFYNLPQNLDGTIFVLRVKKGIEDFKYLQYVEG